MRISASVRGLVAVVVAVVLSGCGAEVAKKQEGPAPTGKKIELKLNLKKGDRRKMTADKKQEDPAPTGKKIELKLNLKKGDRRKMTADMDMNMEMTAPGQGQKMKMNMSMGFGMGFDVLDVDEKGVHTIKATYDRIRMDMTGGPVSIQYDSEKPPALENPMTQVFGAMVGQSLTMKVTPEGKTLEVKGADELAERIAGKLPPLARGGAKQQAESMTQSFDRMMAFLPKKPVDIGDTWSGNMDMTSDPNMPMKVDATYTLYDRKKGKAIVKVDGKMKSSEGLSGTVSGTMTIDEATGWIDGGETSLDMKGTMKGVDAKVKGKFKFGS